jgi:hypothetical protein
MVGSLRIVSQTLGIPIDTVKHWHLKDWWKEYEDEISTQARTARSKKLEKIVEKSAEIIEDRLENGDWYISQSGELRRKPVNAQTAAKIMTSTIDKEVLLERLAQESKKTESEEKMTDRIAKIFSEFQNFAKAKTINSVDAVVVEENQPKGGDPVEVDREPEAINAIYEEREEGLQEGIGVGEHQSEASPEGPGGTAQGESSDGEGR